MDVEVAPDAAVPVKRLRSQTQAVQELEENAKITVNVGFDGSLLVWDAKG